MNINTEELCSVLEGQFLHKVHQKSFRGVSIDSRESDLKQKFFFAIPGTRFDGHDFLHQAVKAGTSALIVHKKISLNINSVTVIQVDDTLKALHRLASWWRKKLNFSVIGITGSTGKTTTKNFCLTLLQPAKSKSPSKVKTYPSLNQEDKTIIASPKSFNNMYGVPLTLLSARENTDIVIQEIGMNQRGEIKVLCQTAQPDIVTVTQIGSSHIGMLGNKNNIAREKEEIYINSPKAIGVFNLDDPYTRAMYNRWNQYAQARKTICFSSQNEKADVFLHIKQIEKYSLSITGHIQGMKNSVSVPVVGSVHLNNLMAASALALAAGWEEHQIWEHLTLCCLPKGRNQWIPLSSGAQALFDAYNASYESVIALLDYFLSPIVKGEKILILGDFMELGTYLIQLQKEVAKRLAQSQITATWLIGDQADPFAQLLKKEGYSAQLYCSRNLDSSIVKKILTQLNSSTVLALKASRKMQMEKILVQLQPQEGESATQLFFS